MKATLSALEKKLKDKDHQIDLLEELLKQSRLECEKMADTVKD